ncbi:DUF5675 family protein [Halanaerobacter jeridensis]|uniref:DUF5675 domain-containing protein n=1 Tax=Halanaerobacter jeridensis TaxID=706427 RepID=A0A938XU37_9FIRM|nr:DUF5675 family protein [Halanaerobacter jeridensis]MBM7555602.1 hypothetical protein [Halanaerobacter jeridensis]
MACMIKIVRYKETKDSTMGNLYLNGKKIGYTLELPWNENKQNESRIPAGNYNAFIREADTSSSWNYDVIQLKNVPNRTAIQIHRGNRPDHTVGCILPGLGKGLNRVWSSEKALNKLLNQAQDGGIKVVIRNKL